MFSLIIFSLFVSFITAVLFPYEVNAKISDWKTYSNITYGIKMDYPSKWLVNESITPENIISFHNPRSDATYMLAKNSTNQIEDSHSYNYSGVGLSIQDLSSHLGHNISLEDYTAIQLDTIVNSPNVYKITDFENYSLGGYPAYKVEYTFDHLIMQNTSDNMMKMRTNDFNGIKFFPTSENITEAWTVKNDKAYIITSIVDNIDKHMKKIKYYIIQKIIDSFDFLDL
jgi:superfamily II DNA helicase RecQ